MSSEVIPFDLIRFGALDIASTTFVPMATVRMKLEPGLHAQLNSCPNFGPACPKDDAEHEARGFFGPLNDGRHMPKTHVYHEGYFHANSKDEPIPSMNPRFSSPMEKPPAPMPLQAFLIAFKKVNAGWLFPLIKKLDLPFLTPETAFADIAAQSHYGDEVAITPDGVGGWHFDAPNSILHLAITLQGRRLVHYQHHALKKKTVTKSVEESDKSSKQKNEDIDNTNSNAKDGDATEETKTVVVDLNDTAEMLPCDVYLTCPSSFMHAVSYPACTADARILALQCRTLMSGRDEYRELAGKVDYDEKAELVGKTLRTAPVRLPTLVEVNEVLEKLKKPGGGGDASSCVVA